MKKTSMLKKNYEFKNVLSKGTYYSGNCIEAFIKENKSKNEKNAKRNFLGIAIGTKIAKATKRNYIKRLIRENYKNYEEMIITGKSIVFLWKKKVDISNATFENIKKDMKKIFGKAKLFIEEDE